MTETEYISKAMLEKELMVAAHKLKVKLIGDIAYGWNNHFIGSGGQRCKDANGNEAWLKITATTRPQLSDYTSWQGWVDAQDLDPRIPKPAYLGSVRHWRKENINFSTFLISYIDEPVCSHEPWIVDDFFLTDAWLTRLKHTLSRFSTHPTTRVNTTQELVTRRLNERFGIDINSSIQQWETVHGDLHWANITQKTPYLLDWDKWGIAPQGLEIGFLFCFSLNNHSISEKIKEVFAQELSTQDAYKSLLFICCELLRMNELYGSYPHLVPNLHSLSQKLLPKILG